MHAWTTRAGVVAGFASTLAFVLVVAVALSDWVMPTCHPSVSVRKHSGRADRVGAYSLSFEVDADLTECFHWNAKQLFVWVTADYVNAANSSVSAVIWDDVRTRDTPIIRGAPREAEYRLRVPPRAYEDITLVFHWSIMSYNGMLPAFASSARDAS